MNTKANTDEEVHVTRQRAAELVRECRSMWPALTGGWTRSEWNNSCRITGRQYLRNALRFLAANREEQS